jgi:hypothetical protein
MTDYPGSRFKTKMAEINRRLNNLFGLDMCRVDHR